MRPIALPALAPLARPAVVALIALVTSGVVGCGDGLGGFLISNEQEVELGQQVDVQLRQEYRIADPADPVSVWAQQLTTPLIAASVSFRSPDEFGGYKVAVIVDDELINAFAGPGGFTYLSTGLILQATTCAEIAGVMGHELGHVTERHSVKKVEGHYGVSVISEWFLGEGLSSQIAQGVYGFLSSTQFSQTHEEESDSVGLQVAYGAGYNPFGLADFFAKLLALSGGSEVPGFLSSHPANQDRIDAVSAEIMRRYNDVEEGVTPSYACVGTTMSLAQVQDHIRQGVAVLPGTGEGPPAEQEPAPATPEE